MPKLPIVLFLSLLSFQVAQVAQSAEPAEQKQKLFNVVLDLKPNSAFQISQITGDIPVSIITDKNKNIVAIEAGGDNVSLAAQAANGGKFFIPAGSVLVGHDWGTKNKIKMSASSQTIGAISNRDLFYLDATGLDAKNGGQVVLRYPSSLIVGTLNEVNLRLRREGSRWVATIQESSFLGMQSNEKIVSRAKIETSFTGLGLQEPTFEFLDPNQVVKALTIQQVSDPAMIESRSKMAKEMADDMVRSPLMIAPQIGLTARVQYESSADREPAAAAAN